MRVELIKPGQEPEKIEISGKSLDELYQHLESEYVKPIRLHEDTFMWYDTDAKQKGKPRNPVATEFLQFAGGMLNDYIAGSILIIGSDSEGELAEADMVGLMSAFEDYQKNKDR